MTIEYLKQLKEKQEEEFLTKNINFISQYDKELHDTQVKAQEKTLDRINTIQEQIDLGRLPKDSANDHITDYVSRYGSNWIKFFYMIFALLLYIPLIFIWTISQIIKFLFSKTSFYEYIIYLPANIMYFLVIESSNIYIYVCEMDGLKEENKILSIEKSKEYADYSVWELFYKK